MTGEFPAQKASNAEKVSTWWRHHAQSHIIVVELVPSHTTRLFNLIFASDKNELNNWRLPIGHWFDACHVTKLHVETWIVYNKYRHIEYMCTPYGFE